ARRSRARNPQIHKAGRGHGPVGGLTVAQQRANGSKHGKRRRLLPCRPVVCLTAAAAAATPAWAEPAPYGAVAPTPSWMTTDLAPAARREGSLTVYSSMNEQEGLPLWKMFEHAAGVQVNYVRSSDSVILSRIAIENRARQRSWDLALTTTVNRLPNDT